MAVGDVYRATVRCNYRANDVAYNVLHYEVDVDPTGQASAGDLALGVEIALGDFYKNFMHADWSWESVTGTRIYPLPPTVPIASSQEAGGGIQTDSPSIPPQNTAVISKLTAFAGRGYRGRSYIPGLCMDFATNGVISPAAILLLNEIGAAMILAIVTAKATYVPCLYSLLKEQPPTVKGRVTRFLAYKTNPTVCTQRRRQVGRGD